MMGTCIYKLGGGNVTFLSATADTGEDLLTDCLAGNIDEALGGGSPLRSLLISSLLSGGISATKGKITGGGKKQTIPALDAPDVRKVADIDTPDVRDMVSDMDASDIRKAVNDIDATDVKNAVKDIDAPDISSGKYSLYGEIAEGDGKAYERFLKDGPQDGLTEAEIIGIYKADKQAALNAIKQNAVSGRGIESGSFTKLNELRNSLPNKYQVIDSYGNKIGNIAYSTSDIEGYSIKELKSFSKYGSKGKNGIKNQMAGWVSAVDKPAYSKDVLKINSDNEIDVINGYLRNNDTEYKIIEQYNQILGGNYEAKGNITIVSEREICLSCDNVIKAFSKDYGNIEITLIDGTGKTYIVKNGVVQ